MRESPLDKNAFNYRIRKKEIATKEDESGKTLYGVQSVIAVGNALLKRTSPRVVYRIIKPTNRSRKLPNRWHQIRLNPYVQRGSGSLLIAACRKLEPGDNMKVCEPIHKI